MTSEVAGTPAKQKRATTAETPGYPGIFRVDSSSNGQRNIKHSSNSRDANNSRNASNNKKRTISNTPESVGHLLKQGRQHRDVSNKRDANNNRNVSRSSDARNKKNVSNSRDASNNNTRNSRKASDRWDHQ